MMTVRTYDSSASTENRQAESTPKRLIALLAALYLLLVLAEFLIFRHYFFKYLAPFYPPNFDQLSTYAAAYHLHFQIVKRGLFDALRDNHLLRACGPMRGALLPLLGTFLTFPLGVNRFSVGILNFIFFVVGQTALVSFSLQRFGLRTALIALGLFLCSNTHYFGLGGMPDLRIDYGGMIASGLALMAILRYLAAGTGKTLAQSVLALLVCEAIRSTSLFYWTGALCLLTVFSLFAKGRFGLRRHACLLLCGSAFALIAVHLILYWKDFSAYYLSCKTSGEDVMRRRESGVADLLSLYLYYPRSFIDHFQVMLGLSASALGISWLWSKVARTASTPKVTGSHRDIAPALITITALTISTMTISASYAPTPVIIGVLTVPAALGLALLTAAIIDANPGKSGASMILASTICLAGVSYYVLQMTRPKFKPQPDQAAALELGKIQEALIAELDASQQSDKRMKPCTVFYTLVNDGLHPVVTMILWYEKKQCEVPDNFFYWSIPAFPAMPAATIDSYIGESRFVIAPARLSRPGYFEYDGIQALRRHYCQLQNKLNEHFTALERRHVGLSGLVVGLYENCKTMDIEPRLEWQISSSALGEMHY